MNALRARSWLKRSTGFTLLELLVVISIIGILVAMGAVAFSTAQKKGRDSKRRSDIRILQDAFEQYNSDNQAYAVCATMDDPAYLPAGVPNDPKTGDSYLTACTADTDAYCVCATLEDVGTGNSSSITNTTTCDYGAGGDFYCLSNLQ